MHLIHRTALDGDIDGFAFKDMPASLAIRGEKVKMESRNTERSSETRRPNAYQISVQFFEEKLFLPGSCLPL